MLPNQRFAVKYPRWEPYAGNPHVRFCAGAHGNMRPYRDSHTKFARSIHEVRAEVRGGHGFGCRPVLDRAREICRRG